MGLRWVFRIYSILAYIVGIVLAGWGMVWLGSDLPGLPWHKAALIRVAGAAIMAAACFAEPLTRLRDDEGLRRALRAFFFGHFILAMVVLSQQKAVWGAPLGDWAVGVLLVTAFAFLYFSIATDIDDLNERRPLLQTLFDPPPPPRQNLRSRYEHQIREAALQEERHRMARDLHDSVKQQIFAIQTAAATAQARLDHDPAGTREALDQVRASARDAMAEMQAMLDQLRAAPLENTGLVEAIRSQAEALGLRTGAKIDFEVGELPDTLAVGPGAQQALFRVAQEALANVARHARATRVGVRLAIAGDALQLTIEDDGAGFDRESAPRGMGLTNMQARAAEFGGTFDLQTRPGGGTRVSVAMPLLRFAAFANRRIVWYGLIVAAHLIAGIAKHSTFFFAMAGFFAVPLARAVIRRIEVAR